MEIPVLGFTKEPPVLREEYDNYALVHFVSPFHLETNRKTIGNAEPDTYIRILSEKERTLTELSMIETELTKCAGHDMSFEVENRVQEKIDNDAMLNGYKLIIGALCVLLAFIGSLTYFPTRWDLFGKGKENLRDICHWHDAAKVCEKCFGLKPSL